VEVVRRRRAAYVVGRAGRADDVRVVGRDQGVALLGTCVGHDEGDVAVLERGEVGDQRVEVVGALDQHQAAVASPGTGTVGREAVEIGVAEHAVAHEHGGGVAEAGVVEDRRRERRPVRGEGHGAGAGR
jgi:hypothetical protein